MDKEEGAVITCIAAIKHRGKIYMAGDRRMSWGNSQAQTMPTAKVIKRDGMLIGGTGSCYLLTLVNTIFRIPAKEIEDPVEYMHNIFHRNLIRFLCDKGFGDKDKHLKFPPDMTLEAVIAFRGRLFSLSIESLDPENPTHNGNVIIDEVALPYATGCGGSLAWGSLLTTETMNISPKERLAIALKVAAEVSPGCNDTIDIISE